MNHQYQLVVMGPDAGRNFPNLRKKLEDDCAALGLDVAKDLGVVDSGKPEDLHVRSLVAGVWFGSNSDVAETKMLKHLMDAGVPVLPLVQSLDQFDKSVPDRLLPINGREWSNKLVPGDILRMLHLTRHQRQAFISYRRSESSGVARQLFDSLTGRGYHVFLDTASVDAAEPFQDVLWSRMADIDLIVFLDSKFVEKSRWVRQELVQAQHLGLGVLRLTWPDKSDDNNPTPGTEFCIGIDLKKHDFHGQKTDPEGTLKAPILQSVLDKVEEVRIESLAHRRRRIMNELTERAKLKGFRVDYQTVSLVTLTKIQGKAAPVAMAIPLIGLPDAWIVHDKHNRAQSTDERKILQPLLNTQDVRVLFDSLGLDKHWAAHLSWLNSCLPLKTVGFDRANPNAADDPLDEWLNDLAGRANL